MSARQNEAYYSYTLAAAAEELDIKPDEVRDLIQRGALDGHLSQGRWKVHLGRRPGQPQVVTLWHGTSRDRAEMVLANGFETVTYGRQIWMTTREKYARGHAIGRAQQRHSEPRVLRCEVDLDRYPFFANRSESIFVFYQSLGKEVVQQVDEVDPRELDRRYRLGQRRQERQGVVGVQVTRHAGPLGVLLWVNAYRQQQGLPALAAEDPAVRRVVDWVEEQYAGGRQTPVEDSELIDLMEAL